MHQELFNYILKYSNQKLSNEQKTLIEEIWYPKKLKKKQFLLQEGEICRFASFINKGAIRQYIVDDSGKENIVQLAIENWWITDRESLFNQIPSKYYIDAWEQTEVLLLKYKNLEKFQTIPAVKEMFWKMNQNNHIASQNRLIDSVNHSAKENYTKLLKTNPDFIQRFPQHIIASYLGITKETLSRVRHQLVK
ncbi:cAMP-binding protein [Croceitalea dokdonensis DOKDO 023]|uniref:cAMP-binding protein n=1 Tax=Croceitalea dokdonensis DOKDO 023 TaxID=1300341 RepID=A0A0P7AV25_9FLAO|nr:Crp/Fnr family transcriptional regulator [Croceitalea dokdonensis]KPM30219.1 cAMP-binding protein [Croceitalea dokdonensis DOKDO 023]